MSEDYDLTGLQPAEEQVATEAFRCGYVALIGRPNVGKSSLLNRLVGQKVSITAPRPQTTRHQIRGIKSLAQTQIIYVDTPGLHEDDERNPRALNRYMNRAAHNAASDVDVVVLVVEALRWRDQDERILAGLATAGKPLILLINKVDKIKEKDQLLPFIDKLVQKADFAEVVPVSARKGQNLERFEETIKGWLPTGPAFYPEAYITDRTERFLAAEFVREKLTRRLGQELPYALAVEVEEFNEAPDHGRVYIHAAIWVERRGQKAIVIGKGGEGLKEVGRQARLDMERAFEARVVLKLWVRVKEDWSANEAVLRHLGYYE